MQRMFVRSFSLTVLALLGLFAFASAQTPAASKYTITNLDSNVTGQGLFTDPLLVNAWGLAYAPTGAFWISDEGTGWSTLYDGSGNPQTLQVIVPPASGTGPGSPAGIVYNGAQEFRVDNWVSIFIFGTLDGTISGWSPISPSKSIIAVKKPGAVYTGLAITSKTTGNFLYAADLANNVVDVYDGTFKLVKSFTDPKLPAGWAPFGIQDIKGNLLVAYAPIDGTAGGQVDLYTEAGTLVARIPKTSKLNQPWGFALAPANFGSLSNTLLVSNNTDTGTINGFNTKTGKYVGTVSDANGKPIVIDQLWGIEFGGGNALNGATNQLFFTAGPNNYVNGTFGVIQLQ